MISQRQKLGSSPIVLSSFLQAIKKDVQNVKSCIYNMEKTQEIEILHVQSMVWNILTLHKEKEKKE